MLDFRSPEPLVITLDEFQYLGENSRELNSVVSKLKAAWKTRPPKRPLVLVLAGSAVRTLEALNEGGSPLYGRFSLQWRLRPFNCWHAGELAGYSDPRERAYAYGIFGGTPRYLNAIDQQQSVADNAVSLMLNPTGEVRELVQTALLQEQGLREIQTYVAILRAVGQGRTELNEIAQGAGLEPDPALRDKLSRPMALDYVGAGRDQHVAPKLGHVHGAGLRGHRRGSLLPPPGRLGLPLVREWGRWEGVDRNRQPPEIDIASSLMDGRVLTGAITWYKAPIDVRIHLQHRAMLDRLAQSGVGWARAASNPESPLLYVAAGGFTDRFIQAARATRDEVYLWSLDDVFKP